MLSSQVDKLRKAAQTYRDLGRYEEEQLLLDAADTIWELRESVHRERAEADMLRTQLADVTVSMGRVEERCAKLREYATKLEQAVTVLDSDNLDLKNDMKDMQFFIDENRKLRELVRQMHTCLTRPKVYAGTSQPYLIATECPYFTQGACDYNSCGFEQRMRELSVEVNE